MNLFADAGAQIFFQPGEGAFKGGAVLPVREIGDVMFADGFRQSFAGVRVQTLPFFQRRVIRQRDGKRLHRFSALASADSVEINRQLFGHCRHKFGFQLKHLFRN